MPEIFYGDWTVEVLEKNAGFSQRFTIDGSDASDGKYPGVMGTAPVAVSGERWSIAMEWNDDAGSGWQPSDVRRTSIGFTLQDGLVMLLGADDNVEQLRDHDFDDLILRCHHTNPTLTPWHPPLTPLDFTLLRAPD
ncbi:MAG: hypothetical protein ACRDTE_10880 [Pseudonocardiaceae bacterium]